MRRHLRLLVASTLAASAVLSSVGAQHGIRNGEWRSYNGDAGSTKYAPLDQINRDNVSKLQLLWRRPAVDAEPHCSAIRSCASRATSARRR